MNLTTEQYVSYQRAAAERADINLSEVLTPAEHHVVLGQMNFHYLDWGTVGKPTVIFLHGGGLTAHTWDLCCLALRSRYRCVALDQRGHGDSEWASDGDYSIATQSRDIQALLDHLREKMVYLVGMSMGGLNALQLAINNSDRLAGIVIVDAGPEPRLEAAKEMFDFVNKTVEFESVEAAVEQSLAFNPKRNAKILRFSLLHNLRRLPNGNWTWKYDRRRFEYVQRQGFKEECNQLWQGTARVHCPVLVVRGAESKVFLEADALRLASSFPSGQLATVERAGHNVQGDNPKALIALLQQFLEKSR